MIPLTFFVPVHLTNPLNGPHGAHWAATAAMRKRLRTATHVAAIIAVRATAWEAEPGPRAVTFHARTWNTFDSDGLQAALKPCRDGLVDAGVLDSDAPAAGHTFTYTQVIDRRRRGVAVTVTARA